MAVDRVGEGADTDVELAVGKKAHDRRPPPDNPGAEGAPSRADSRAMAAIESDPPDEAPEALVPKGQDRGSAVQPYAERLDTPISDDQPTPREVLARFDPVCAGLSEISEDEAREYIKLNSDQRPWLTSAKDCDPAVQRVIAAMDRGQGHALERHEGYADDDKLMRRVTALEDPAQLDPDKRVAGIDGCKPGHQNHLCGDTATAIQDPVAFATAFARGVEHPDTQWALQAQYRPGWRPGQVSLRVDDLLGADGHRYCTGFGLEPVGGSRRAAQDCRMAWVDARRPPMREADVPAPKGALIENFKGSTVEFFFRSNRAKDGYEVSTMYVQPSRRPEGENCE